jgi:hypothetical protein
MTGPGNEEDYLMWPCGWTDPYPAQDSRAAKPEFCTFPIAPLKGFVMSEKTIKVDPSVRREDTENKGEPLGSVPMSVTMGKPQAYKPAKAGPK